MHGLLLSSTARRLGLASKLSSGSIVLNAVPGFRSLPQCNVFTAQRCSFTIDALSDSVMVGNRASHLDAEKVVKHVYERDSAYEGELVDGKRSGKGKATFANGDVYTGDFANGMMHGHGIMVSAKGGGVYEGAYLNNKQHGQGTLTLQDGTKYVGDCFHGQRTGKGQLTSANGICYTGDFVDGKREGRGVQRFPNGVVYEGEYKNNQQHGRGKLTLTTGAVYEGQFVKGHRHGVGHYVKGKVTYTGEWVRDKRCGTGSIVLSNGNLYVGQFLDDLMHGPGKMSYAQGGTPFDGMWEYGRKVRAKEEVPPADQ